VLITHDVYPHVLAVTGILGKDSLAYRFMAGIAKWTYLRMKAIVVLGRDMYQLIADSIEGYQHKIRVIPNWADLDQITPQSRNHNTLLLGCGLQDRFVLQYSGNMGRTHDLEIVLNCAMLLCQQEHIHFLLIGDGAKRAWLESAIKSHSLSNVTLLPPCDRSELNTQLNACDIALVSFRPGMSGVSVPSRMYNILAAGKPIIAVTETYSELALVVQEERIGWVVPPGDTNALSAAIQNARFDLQCLQEMGMRARRVAESKYGFAQAIHSYQELIAELA
jgi:glycosyltransferase involved in cell wall biosynthesis